MKPDQDTQQQSRNTMSRDDQFAFWLAIAICLFTVFI